MLNFNKLPYIHTKTITYIPKFIRHFRLSSPLPFFEIMKCGERIRAWCFGKLSVISEQVTNSVIKLIENSSRGGWLTMKH